MSEVLDDRALNRALLARQHLLERAELSVESAVEHLVGLQAQATAPPYLALWARLETFVLDDLTTLLQERRVVRLALMRSTVHLVSAADCLRLRPLFGPMLARYLHTSTPFGRQLEGVDPDELARLTDDALDAAPHTNAELRAVLGARWPDHDPTALIQGARHLCALVQLPPRGVWGVGGQVRVATARAWLGRPLEAEPSLDDLLLRYLGAFGPATVADAQAWSGLRGLREPFERLRPRLVTFADGRCRELFDLPDAPRPGPDAAAPVRFLGEYDNALLGHADRTRIVGGYRWAESTGTGQWASFLHDGMLAGTWKVETAKGRATLLVRSFAPLRGRARSDVEAEGERLLGLVAPDAATRELDLALR